MNAADIQACKTLMRGGSKSFYLSSLALPKRVRAPATALYAFCRVADDAIDNSTEPARALADLQARLDAVYAGRPRGDDSPEPVPSEDRAIPRARQQPGSLGHGDHVGGERAGVVTHGRRIGQS